VMIGDSRADTLKRIGPPLLAKQSDIVPAGVAPGPELGPAPAGSACDYYQESDTWQDPGVMRLCYRYDLVIEKSAYDMGAGVQGGDATAEICVWRASSSGPDCN
jgi:hypothetical protein